MSKEELGNREHIQSLGSRASYCNVTQGRRMFQSMRMDTTCGKGLEVTHATAFCSVEATHGPRSSLQEWQNYTFGTKLLRSLKGL